MGTVLVTGAGSAGGTGTIKSLAEHTSHEIVGVDMDPTAEGLCLAEKSAVVPPAAADEWPTEMRAVVAEHDVDVVVPLVDEELKRIGELAAELPEGVGIVAPREEVVRTALDKYETHRALAEAGLSTPKTELGTDPDEFEDEDYPVISKPRFGRGSRGVTKLDSPEALAAHLESTDRSDESLILQQFVEGDEYTTSVVSTKDDRLLNIVPKEAISKDGCTTRGVTRLAPSVVHSCYRIYSAFRPRGPLNVQQIVDEETGSVYTIELNPRFSSTACLTVAAGVNELDLLVRDAMGEHVTGSEEFTEGLHLIRYTDELFVPEGELKTERGSEAEAAEQTETPPNRPE